jgi:hypothetical protein
MKKESFPTDLVNTFKHIGFVVLSNHGLSK